MDEQIIKEHNSKLMMEKDEALSAEEYEHRNEVKRFLIDGLRKRFPVLENTSEHLIITTLSTFLDDTPLVGTIASIMIDYRNQPIARTTEEKINMRVKMDVHEIAEVKPSHYYRGRTRLTIDAVIDRHQVAELYLKMLNEYPPEQLNAVFEHYGFRITSDELEMAKTKALRRLLDNMRNNEVEDHNGNKYYMLQVSASEIEAMENVIKSAEGKVGE